MSFILGCILGAVVVAVIVGLIVLKFMINGWRA